MNIFGIGLPEMAVILVLALLIFGPKKLPEIGRSLGKTIRGFQEASKDFENEFKREAAQIDRPAKISEVEVVAMDEPEGEPIKSATPPKSSEAIAANSNSVATPTQPS